MDNVHPTSVSVGRIQNPIIQIVERIQSFLRERSKTVSSDKRGNLFIRSFDGRATEPGTGHEIGTYNHATPLSVIENDLRLELRERARKWIVDWDAPSKPMPQHGVQAKRARRARALRIRKDRPLPVNAPGE